MFRTLIVDDERLARNELKRLVQKYPEIEIIGEASDSEAAQKLCETLQPDLLFLDIQMPGQSVFTMLTELEPAPLVIFTTAYDEYALKAFEVNALDYLLKPIDPPRLELAIKKLLEHRSIEPSPKVEQTFLKPAEQVFVKDGERCWFVKVQDIRLLESEGNYTRLYFDSFKPLLARSLNSLELRFDPQIFFRASRKHIVNLAWITNIEPSWGGSLILYLQGDIEIPVSRRQAQRFRELKSL